jgi:UDP-4-amino-4-deoxy-L-arabinose formyltransferase/UDP-glucuronic acid dehydrogenase (UDP-4-keto-hexauronic acid decarboxylating)
MKYNVTVFGNKTTTADLIRHLTNDGHDIGLVVTLSTESEASKDIAGADDIAKLAEALSIPVHVTQDYKLKSETDKTFFADNDFGIGICTGWQRLLPKHVIEAFPAGVFGFHGSCWKFPHGRGRSPLNWSMRLGGNTIYHNCFRYVEEADAGEVFNTTEFPISPFDSISSVQFKALLDMKLVSGKLLKQYESGKVAAVRQADGAAIMLPKLGPPDGLIRFAGMSRAEILRIWRAIPFDFPFDCNARDSKTGAVIDSSLGQTLIKCVDGYLLATDADFVSASKEVHLGPGLQFI